MSRKMEDEGCLQRGRAQLLGAYETVILEGKWGEGASAAGTTTWQVPISPGPADRDCRLELCLGDVAKSRFDNKSFCPRRIIPNFMLQGERPQLLVVCPACVPSHVADWLAGVPRSSCMWLPCMQTTPSKLPARQRSMMVLLTGPQAATSPVVMALVASPSMAPSLR